MYIYIVRGNTGIYEERKSWSVSAHLTLEAAEVKRDLLNSSLSILGLNKEIPNIDDREKAETDMQRFDEKFRQYDGWASYTIEIVPIQE